MKTIYKYTLTGLDKGRLELPVGAEILTVQEQRGMVCLWAIVEPKAKKETRVFKIFGTGHDIPDNPGKYINTFMTDGGAFVWHVFEDFFRITEVKTDEYDAKLYAQRVSFLHHLAILMPSAARHLLGIETSDELIELCKIADTKHMNGVREQIMIVQADKENR